MNIPWNAFNEALDASVAQTFDALFETLEGIEGEVKVLQDRHTLLSRDQLADLVIGEAARATAMIGGSAALPDLLPTSWPMMLPAIAGDFALTLRTELAMLLKLAYLFGTDLPREDRKKEAIGILASYRAPEGSEASTTRGVGVDMVRLGSKHVSRKAFVLLARKIGERFLRKKLMAFIPVFGIAFSGGVNYVGSKNLGEFAKKYYQNRTVPHREAATVASEVQHFQRCYIQVMINMAKIDRQVSKEEETLLADALTMFGFTKEERDRFLGDLYDLDSAKPITAEDIGRLTEEDCRFILKQGIAMMYADRKKAIQEANYLEVLRKRFGLNPEVVNHLESEVRSEMGIA